LKLSTSLIKPSVWLVASLFSQVAAADIFWFVRNTDGSTNWQYVANFSSGILIIALSLTALWLFFSRRQANRYNIELEEIRTQLELRVKERTATLEDEIAEHRDTTAKLRSSEAYITSILRSMPLMLIGLNKENQITQWNHRAEEISGLPSDAVVGQELWDAYPSISLTPAQIQQALDDNETLTIKYSQRGQYHFDITIYPLQEQSETGVVILLDDVTQRVKNEIMLIQRDKMSSMGEMASVMAHDISIPLRAMIKDVKAVRHELTDEPIDAEGLQDVLEDAVIRGQQATSIIENLLRFSTGGGDRTEANMVDVINHSVELANDVLSVMAGLRFRDVKVNIDCPDETPDIPCYITELQQTFLNLFRHCCQALGQVDDFNDEHIPTINIEVTVFYDNLWVRIQHNGRGISLEEQKTIFEPYATSQDGQIGDDADKRLSFCHFIITEQHQGQIALTSDPDVGTTFHIQLPLQ